MRAAPPEGFKTRVRMALADGQLRTALDRAVTRFSVLRAAAFGSMAEADRLRDRARSIRAHTLSRLDSYLAQFAEAVQAVGGRAHWAADAAEARRIVTDLARAAGARTIVKSKSMISEEIRLNQALESAGFEVVETDLGEYIIQLAGETPSHILAPAVHRTKEQVGRLLHEKLGMPLTDDPAEMTAAVRRKLREAFLTADMGITGVNFGVAETGTLCLVTNEGNGRMTTSLPRVHVALMGIERLVPGLDDLAVMLQVLASSATGQKLSVYTSMITGPRRARQEADGPDEIHVVLVDNGRSRVLGSEIAEILHCIRCGACLNVCPVYRVIGGHAYGSVYSGPVGSVLTPALEGPASASELPHASSLCGACRDVCPVRIDLPALLLRLRDQAVRARLSPAWLRIGMPFFRFVALRPRIFRGAIRFGRLTLRLLGSRDGWVSRLPHPFSGWTEHRDFPLFAAQPFHSQLEAHRAGRRGRALAGRAGDE